MSGVLHGILAGLAGAKDTFWKYVTLLLPGNGTNGAQNNTFIDGSTNNFTITRNGNTTQGTFTPFGSNWSNYFDGSGDYLTAPNSTAFDLPSDFTIECWVYFNSLATTSIVGKWGGATKYAWILQYISATGLNFYTGASGSLGTQISGAFTAMVNTWYHIAVTRSSNSVRLFVDGVQVGSTTTNTDNLSATNQAVNIGRNEDTNIQYLTGYISNLRIVKGTAVYTANFTPPTAPLTAITNTSLLTCQSNRFVDNSTNAFTITRNGDVSVQRFSPFSPTDAYSTSVVSGSGYFDGAGDYLSTSGTSSFNPSTGSWTFEAWCYFTSSSNTDYLVTGLTSGTASFYIAWVGTTFYVGDGVINNINAIASSKPVNQWFHVAVVKNGSTYTAYINGSSIASSTTALASSTTTTFEIGARSPASLFSIGYISNFRYSQSAVYTAAFTPPASPVTGGALLLNFTNAGIIDNAMMNDLETVGNAQISTAQSKFGGASMYFDGTGDYLVSNSDANNYAFGSGDFTIECWLYLSSTSGQQTIYDSRPASTQGIYASIYCDAGVIKFFVNSADRITGSTLSATTWYHIALSRSGTSTKLFVDGTQVGATYTDSNSYLNPAQRPVIGSSGYTLNTNTLNGYIDDLRITKGVARYTANFTPPGPLPTS